MDSQFYALPLQKEPFYSLGLCLTNYQLYVCSICSLPITSRVAVVSVIHHHQLQNNGPDRRLLLLPNRFAHSEIIKVHKKNDPTQGGL